MTDSPRKYKSSRNVEEDRVIGKIYDSRLLKKLLAFGKPYAFWILLAVLLIILASGLEILGPYLTKIAVDRYIIANEFHGLLILSAIYLAVLFLNFGVRYFQVFLTQYIGQRIIYDIRNKVYRHLQFLHQQYFDRNPVGRLMTRVTSDVEALNQMFTQGLVMVFGDLFLLIGIVTMMLSIHWKLALWTFSVIPFLFLISFLFRKKVRSAYGSIRYYLAKINAFMQERISGMAVVQLFNREERDFEEFSGINWQHTAAFIKTIFYYALFYPGVQFISAVALAIIIFRGGWMIHSQAVTLGVLIAFIQYARMFFRPISDLSEKYNILQSALASSERIFKLLETEPAMVSPENGHRQASLRGEIEFQHVSFAYGDELVLHDINLKVPAGKGYALVGHTGAGKTSLIRLIGRFYDANEGQVLVDGVDVRHWQKENLRSHMAVVLQDVFLFSGTILENIRLGRTDISYEKVVEAAKLVNAHKFIRKIPGEYNALLREKGSNLSAGQKQLLSLARALVMDPDVILLDEATANIDSESEALIQDALKRVLKNRTAIVVAHRLSTIQHMDQIVVLHKGRVREQGAHQELLKQKGLYFKLYQLQYKDQFGREQKTEIPGPPVKSSIG